MDKYSAYKAIYKKLIKTAAPKWLKVLHTLSQKDVNKLPFKSYETMHSGIKKGNENIISDLKKIMNINISTGEVLGSGATTSFNKAQKLLDGAINSKPNSADIILSDTLKHEPLSKQMVLRHELNEIASAKRLNNNFSNKVDKLKLGVLDNIDPITLDTLYWTHISPEVIAKDINIMNGISPKVRNNIYKSDIEALQFRQVLDSIGYESSTVNRLLNSHDLRKLRKFDSGYGALDFVEKLSDHPYPFLPSERVSRNIENRSVSKNFSKDSERFLRDIARRIKNYGDKKEIGKNKYYDVLKNGTSSIAGIDGYSVPIHRRLPGGSYRHDYNNLVVAKDGVGALIDGKLNFIPNSKLDRVDIMTRLSKLGLTIDNGKIVKLTGEAK